MALLEIIQAHQILSTIGLLLLAAFGYHILVIVPTPSEPPLIKGYLPLLGVTPQIILSPVSFLNSCRARYGDIFTIYALGFRVTLVTDPIQGIPAVFRKSKQLSFKAGLRRVYTKVLGFSEQRVEEEDMNREHFQMIPPYLLASSAVDGLTGRFLRFLLQNLRREESELRKGKIVNLADWIGEMLFFASGPALYGEGIFDGADSVLNDFKTAENAFPARLILPLWMTRWFEPYRNRVQGVLSSGFAKGLKDPSEFVKKRIEVTFPLALYLMVDSNEIWIFSRTNWKRCLCNHVCIDGIHYFCT
jgi:oxysterol 7-alpha-hydroxylase